MGASPRLEIVAGIRLSPTALHAPAGKTWACPNGHARSDSTWMNCPNCGGRFTLREMEEETDLYRKLLAAAKGGDEDRLYCRSDEQSGLHQLWSGYGNNSGVPVVLGVAPKRSYSDTRVRDGGDAYLFDLPLAEIVALVEEASKLCKSFGVEGDVKLYICGSISW